MVRHHSSPSSPFIPSFQLGILAPSSCTSPRSAFLVVSCSVENNHPSKSSVTSWSSRRLPPWHIGSIAPLLRRQGRRWALPALLGAAFPFSGHSSARHPRRRAHHPSSPPPSSSPSSPPPSSAAAAPAHQVRINLCCSFSWCLIRCRCSSNPTM